jgi:hypothetical protein
MTLQENHDAAIQFVNQFLPEEAGNLIYQIGAIGDWHSQSKINYWHTGHHMANVFINETIINETICENHKGKRIAIFRLKAWK